MSSGLMLGHPLSRSPKEEMAGQHGKDCVRVGLSPSRKHHKESQVNSERAKDLEDSDDSDAANSKVKIARPSQDRPEIASGKSS